MAAAFAPTNDWPRGPEGKARCSDARPNGFMWDDELGDGIEFAAIELSSCGRNILWPRSTVNPAVIRLMGDDGV